VLKFSRSERFAHLFLLLTLAQVLHSIEEIVYRLYDWQPGASLSLNSIFRFRENTGIGSNLFAEMNIVIIVLLFLLTIQLYRSKRWAVSVSLVAAFIEFLNGTAHLAGLIYFRQYFPGCISAVGLLLCALLFLGNYYRPAVKEVKKD